MPVPSALLVFSRLWLTHNPRTLPSISLLLGAEFLFNTITFSKYTDNIKRRRQFYVPAAFIHTD